MCERRKRTTDENATGRGDRTKYFRMCVSACVNPKIRWKVRYAIDYRKLNSVTKMDVYPLPLVEDFLDTLSGNEWFSKLDANNAYYQMSVKSEHRPKTAFITKYGLFHFTRMSVGLCKARSTYARAMDLVLRGLNWQIVLAFLDDILVMGRNVNDHLNNLRLVFEQFREYGIQLKAKKCDLCKKRSLLFRA